MILLFMSVSVKWSHSFRFPTEITLFTQKEGDFKSRDSPPTKKHVCTENVILCVNFIQLVQDNVNGNRCENMLCIVCPD
jgi:hypothetical protein